MIPLSVLIDLYKIRSPSGQEREIKEYVEDFLKREKIKYNIDKYNQIFYLKKNTPLICAHMDTVELEPSTEFYMEYGGRILGKESFLGADDKNGVWILLNLIKIFKNSISFIFSTEEESMKMNIASIFDNRKILDSIKYCLVFDRRDGGDIIGTRNGYCNEDLENDIAEIGKEFKYKPASGIVSDCDAISTYGIPCVNLSCGYYKAHTKKEYTILKELIRSYKFGVKILKTLDKTYSRVEPILLPNKNIMVDDCISHECPNCGFELLDDKIKKGVCPFCNTEIEDSTELFMCDLCRETFPEEDLYEIEVNSEKLYICDDCFYTLYEYCDNCGEAFPIEEIKKSNMFNMNLCENCLTLLGEEYT